MDPDDILEEEAFEHYFMRELSRYAKVRDSTFCAEEPNTRQGQSSSVAETTSLPKNVSAPQAESTAAEAVDFWQVLTSALEQHFDPPSTKKILAQFRADNESFVDSLNLDQIESLAQFFQ